MGASVLTLGTPMLETLVPSKVRRALFEYLLSHPGERFYLRGLAKELGLSVTPLRRELKRLEQSGVLQTVPEGQLLFYTANPQASVFQELQQAGVPAKAPSSAVAPQALSPAAGGLALLRRPLLFGAGVLLLGLAMVGAGLWKVWGMEQRLSRSARPALVQPSPRIERLPEPPATGAMRGARWQLLPGAVGGFGKAREDSEPL